MPNTQQSMPISEEEVTDRTGLSSPELLPNQPTTTTPDLSPAADISPLNSPQEKEETSMDIASLVETSSFSATIAEIPQPAALDDNEDEDTLKMGEALPAVTESSSVESMDNFEGLIRVVPTTLPLSTHRTRPGLLRLDRHRLRLPRLKRAVLAYALLGLLVISSLALWRDATDTHLYLSTLDASTGQVLSQDEQFSNPSPSGTLTTTPTGLLVVEQANSVQVKAKDGHLLWQRQGDQPTRGEHPFQPAFDDKTLYTLVSAHTRQVGAYDLQTGSPRWIHSLDDTFNYAPPWLVYNHTLYMAGDHYLYALNSLDGSVLWRILRPSRTLLLHRGTDNQPFLVTAGVQGLAALNPATGAVFWSFGGQRGANASLSPTQFYQATSTASSANRIYATGIAWDEGKVQEQLWLYAVDASSGTLWWAVPIGTEPAIADAGRLFAPLVDTKHGLVFLEQRTTTSGVNIAAFDASSGILRWNTHLDGDSNTAIAPALAQTPNGNLTLLSTVANSTTILHSWSLVRAILIASIGLCLVLLLRFCMLPWRPALWLQRLQAIRRALPHYLIYPLKLIVRLWRYSHRLFALMCLLLLIGGGVLGYVQLNQPQVRLSQVTASTGTTQWQHIISVPTQAERVDAQGSVLITSIDGNLHQLQALDQNGTVQWRSIASEGTFSLPNIPSPPGTLLVALSGVTDAHYQFAPDDPAYPPALEHLFSLALLQRTSGQVLWQSIVTSPERQQDALVLGADTRFIYIASKQTFPAPSSVQLIAVDWATGSIMWNVFGPAASSEAAPDAGILLLENHQLIWQVAGAIYSIDTTLGQIQWRQFLASDHPDYPDHPQTLQQEEAQMAESSGILFVERNGTVHALDATTGNELWKISSSSPNFNQIPSSSGLAVSGSTLIVYGNGVLQAIDLTNRRVIWSQQQPNNVQKLQFSEDGTLIYVLLQTSVKGLSPAQALLAFDTKTGVVRWTFQPSTQAQFLNLSSVGLPYYHGTLLATVCLPAGDGSCPQQRLYALNAQTGEIRWKRVANSISNVHFSADGSTVLFQENSSSWLDLSGHFRG